MKKALLALSLLLATPAPRARAEDPEGLTHELDGVEITYSYAGGGSYNVKYTAEGVKYRFLSGDAADEWWGPFPYKAFKTANGEYFLGWYEKGYGDQITHLVNLKSRTLYGSGIIVKKDHVIEHFAKATITKIVMPAGQPARAR